MKAKYKNLFKNLGLFTIGSFGSKLVTFLLLPLIENFFHFLGNFIDAYIIAKYSGCNS